MAKKHSGPVLDEHLESTPKAGKGRYLVSSTHRRTVSFPEVREDVWSDGDGQDGIEGRAKSLDLRQSQQSGIGLMFKDDRKKEGEAQLANDKGRGQQRKVLAATKELVTQKVAGVTHSMKEGRIIDKLVEMEDKAVKLKVSKEGTRLFQ